VSRVGRRRKREGNDSYCAVLRSKEAKASQARTKESDNSYDGLRSNERLLDTRRSEEAARLANQDP